MSTWGSRVKNGHCDSTMKSLPGQHGFGAGSAKLCSSTRDFDGCRAKDSVLLKNHKLQQRTSGSYPLSTFISKYRFHNLPQEQQ